MNTGMRHTFGRSKTPKIGSPNFFINNFYKLDCDSVTKLVNVINGVYADGDLPNPRNTITEKNLGNITIIDHPTDPELCSLSFYAKNVTSLNWYSFAHPDVEPLFDSYIRSAPPASDPTYFIDLDNQIDKSNGRGFFNDNNNIEYLKTDGIINLTPQLISTMVSPPRVLEFPNAKIIENPGEILFNNWRLALDRIYLPKLIPQTPTYDRYFNNWSIRRNNALKIVYLHPDWGTINSGNRHASLDYMASKNGFTDFRYVTNFVKPNAVTDLSFTNVEANNLTLNFSIPSINTNLIDFFEVWLDDATNNVIQQNFPLGEVNSNGESINFFSNLQTKNIEVNNLSSLGLKSNTTYTLKLKTVDYLYNKSNFSNEITFTTL